MKSFLPPFWELFNSRFKDTEKRVYERDGSYKDLSQEALYSSFEDLVELFQHPLVKGTFLDLGCGMGQAPLLYGYLFPERRALGIEFDRARYDGGQEIQKSAGITNVELLHQDLLTCDIKHADVYFLYFPTGPVLDRILEELYESQERFFLVGIESHGDLLPRLDLEDWLLRRDEVPLKSGRHYPYARIYERTFQKRKKHLEPFYHSFKKHFIVIDSGEELWVGETFGMEWTHDDRFELQTPPRTITWSDVKEVWKEEEVPVLYSEALHLRRSGELTIKTSSQTYRGLIRKIIISPSFLVEISTGERVEWSEIITISQGPRLCYASSSHS